VTGKCLPNCCPDTALSPSLHNSGTTCYTLLKMAKTDPFETLITVYQTTRRHASEGSDHQSQSLGSQTSCIEGRTADL
jgi:hypothetical protein